MEELLGSDRLRISGLVENRYRELSVDCVLHGLSPGKVLVDDVRKPSAFLIRSPECILIGGDDRNEAFNSGVKDELSFYDAVVCDSLAWEERIAEIHQNIALLPFTRKSLAHTAGTRIVVPESDARVEYLYASDIGSLTYGNSHVVLEWVDDPSHRDILGVCLGALVLVDATIVSCSCLDCRHEGRAEIGVKTISGHRKKGYGLIAVSSMINELRDNGILDIGWHCMATNIGSRRIAERSGFIEVADYKHYSPYPPIENVQDITTAEWRGLASFYAEKGKASVDQLWQAARCWAKAGEGDQAIDCVRILAEHGRLWILNNIDECEEFSELRHSPAFIRASSG